MSDSQLHLTPPGWFRRGYGFLNSLYPSHQRSDEELAAYETDLAAVAGPDLDSILAQASILWPRFFPTAGELKTQALHRIRTKRAAGTSRPEPEDPTARLALPEDDPYEKLARMFQRYLDHFGHLDGAAVVRGLQWWMAEHHGRDRGPGAPLADALLDKVAERSTDIVDDCPV